MSEVDPKRPPRPVGWRRTVARLPMFLFRVGLGPMFCGRLLLLHHRGRATGRDRRVVLEVVAFESNTSSWIVASGFGPRSDWYRNLLAEPKTLIQFGNRHHAVTARFLAASEGAEIMADYGRRHPRAARRLCAFMRLPSGGGEDVFLEAGRAIPFVRLDGARHPSS